MFFCSLNEPDYPAQSPQGVTESNYSKHRMKQISSKETMVLCWWETITG